MSLMKVGGKSDGGVDLQGWWYVPVSQGSAASRLKQGQDKTTTTSTSRITWKAPDGTIRHRYRVLGQCKAEQKKVGPRYVRELEGVLGRFEKSSVVGILVSESEFTRSALLTAYSSKYPLFLLRLPPPDELQIEEPHSLEGNSMVEPIEIGSAVWNPALGANYGLFKGELEILWERSVHSVQGRPVLWRKGKKVEGWIPPEDDTSFRQVDAVS